MGILLELLGERGILPFGESMNFIDMLGFIFFENKDPDLFTLVIWVAWNC